MATLPWNSRMSKALEEAFDARHQLIHDPWWHIPYGSVRYRIRLEKKRDVGSTPASVEQVDRVTAIMGYLTARSMTSTSASVARQPTWALALPAKSPRTTRRRSRLC